jgi:outer membrane receptor protein involved in Fe transport
VANGFPRNSPYNAYLPYDIKQKAVFGELNYTLGKLTATAGGRYYDFSETRQFKSGGLFANGDNRTDKTSSNGFTPRFLLSYEASDNVTFNAQASKGFRLGGVNDPLNLPLCTPQDATIFGGYQSYNDESLWNYEGGVKSRFGRVTFNGAAFYTDIKQPADDAGRRLVLVARGVQRGQGPHQGRRGRVPGPPGHRPRHRPVGQPGGSRVRQQREGWRGRYPGRHPRRQPPAVGAEVPDLGRHHLHQGSA